MVIDKKEKEMNWWQEILAHSFVGLLTLVGIGIIITAIVMAFSGPILYKYIFWGLISFIVVIFLLYWIGRLILRIRDSI